MITGSPPAKAIFKKLFFPDPAQFKAPVFKICTLATGQSLTSGGPDQPVKLLSSFSDTDDQKW